MMKMKKGCGNALKGATFISTTPQPELTPEHWQWQCPERGYLHFYTMKKKNRSGTNNNVAMP